MVVQTQVLIVWNALIEMLGNEVYGSSSISLYILLGPPDLDLEMLYLKQPGIDGLTTSGAGLRHFPGPHL